MQTVSAWRVEYMQAPYRTEWQFDNIRFATKEEAAEHARAFLMNYGQKEMAVRIAMCEALVKDV